MTVALVVVYDTTRVASEQELVVLGELDARDSSLVVVDHVNGADCLLVELEDADFVIEIAADVQVHIFRAASVVEVREQVLQLFVHVLVAQHQVYRSVGHVSVLVQVIRVYLHDDIALLHTVALVGHLFALLFFLALAQEDQALTVTTWRNEHHMDHIFVLKLLVVGDLPHKRVLLVIVSLRAIVLDEVVDKVCGVHDFLLPATGLSACAAVLNVSVFFQQLRVLLLVYDAAGLI